MIFVVSRHANTTIRKTDAQGLKMERLKNIGLSPLVHKQLKLLCAQEGWTMTEAVQHLLEILREQEDGKKEPNAAAKVAGDV